MGRCEFDFVPSMDQTSNMFSPRSYTTPLQNDSVFESSNLPEQQVPYSEIKRTSLVRPPIQLSYLV